MTTIIVHGIGSVAGCVTLFNSNLDENDPDNSDTHDGESVYERTLK